ncbi:MAG TPA: alpha/beta fold hydrolase [Pirellulaceae bacterium]|nr:alpha/beta fold hydrolase [Pirellulaceae bacterium]
MCRRPWFYLPLAFLATLAAKAGGHDAVQRQLRIQTPLADVAGTLLIPHVHERVPIVVLIGGTLSQDRDGRMFDQKAPPRDALRRWGEALQAGGYASFRYDKVGSGQSQAKTGWKGTYSDEAAVAAAVIKQLQQDPRFGKVIVAGESAGAYVACLAAKDGTQADGYLFLGAFCGRPEELYEYNFGRLSAFADSSADRMAWAKDKVRYELALGRHYRGMLAAAEGGQDEYSTDDDGFAFRIGGLVRRREELSLRPDEMFRHIKTPALALAGKLDRNVPPEHAEYAARFMREAGNDEATHRLIDGTDHSFQQAAAEEETQIRERYELTSFRRPYSAKAYRTALEWLYENFPTEAESHDEQLEQIAARATPQPKVAAASRAQEGPEFDPVTENTPRRVQLAPGVEIVPDITDREQTAGVETLEGRIGPLLLGDGSQAHFIEMQGGMFVAEHPHASESIIYTVRGQWVLCSRGRRQLMQPGTLFRFAAGAPTGYEVPFDEPALILIFKGDRLTKEEREFMDYLKGMAGRLEKEHAQGVPYLMGDLPADHPARVFAKEVNPKFDPKP